MSSPIVAEQYRIRDTGGQSSGAPSNSSSGGRSPVQLHVYYSLSTIDIQMMIMMMMVVVIAIAIAIAVVVIVANGGGCGGGRSGCRGGDCFGGSGGTLSSATRPYRHQFHLLLLLQSLHFLQTKSITGKVFSNQIIAPPNLLPNYYCSSNHQNGSINC